MKLPHFRLPFYLGARYKPVSLAHRIFIAFLIVTTLITTGIFVIIVVVFINFRLSVHSQDDQYKAAVASCGTDPVVAIDSQTFDEDDTLKLYSPLNPQYNAEKTIVAGPLDFLGGDSVSGYYCSMLQARIATNDQTGDVSANYSSIAQEKKIYLLSEQALGAKFYQPNSVPAGFTLASSTYDYEDSIIYNYVASDAAVNSQPDYSGRSIEVVTGTNFYKKTILYALDQEPETQQQIWDTVLPGAQCELTGPTITITATPTLSEQTGTSLLASLRSVPYTTILQFKETDDD
jgi:hypothetical protein